MRNLALSLAAALLFAACGDSSPSTSTPVPTGTPVLTASPGPSSLGKLAFIRDRNLWLLDVDSGKETPLVEVGDIHNPRFSHDGSLIAYGEVPLVGGSAEGLYVIPLTEPGHSLPVDSPVLFWEWSPAEPLLAYQLAGDNSVWIYDASNGDKAQIVAPHQRQTPFAWSPDGRYLAYGVAEYTAGDQLVIGASSVDVYDVETGATRQLVTRNDGAIPHVQSWSPDGSRLAYWLRNISESINADGAELWWADLKGGATGLVGTTLIYDEAVVWKHTGDTAALAASEGGGREMWVGKDLRLVRPDPPFPAEPLDVRVAAPGFSEVEPSWQPRGTSLAFVRIPEPQDAGASHVDSFQMARIWTVNDDGTGETQLTDDAAYSDRLPRFSADGQHILFLRLRTGNWSQDSVPAELWVMRADGSNADKVADAGSIGWFGYYGRIDPETLFDWYQPDLFAGALGAVPRCSATQLEVRVRRGTSGLGLGAKSLEFNNVSDMPCSLRGTPDVFLLAEPSGRPSSEAVKPCEAPAPPTASICGPEDGVVLDPGERAAVDVLYWSWREDFECSTPRVRGTHLRIDLPRDGGSIAAPLDAEGISPCDHKLDIRRFHRLTR